MKLERLSGRKINEHVMRKGRVWKGKTMNIRWLSGAPRGAHIDASVNAIFLGTFASTSLHKSAVKRNRMRRRCREAMRLFLKEHENLPTCQLLMSPRIASLDCAYGLIASDVQQFFATLTSWPQKAEHRGTLTSR